MSLVFIDDIFIYIYLLMMTILTSVRSYFIVVLTCISLMISDIEHLFICLLAICMSSLEKWIYSGPLSIFYGLFVFVVLSFISSLELLAINLYQMNWRICSSNPWVAFLFCWWSYLLHKNVFSLMYVVPFVYFFFCFPCLGRHIW